MPIQPITPMNYKRSHVFDNFQKYKGGPINTPQQGMNLAPYGGDKEMDLLKNKDYAGLLKFQDNLCGEKKFALIRKYLSLPSFDELAQSEYFNSPTNFNKLTKAIANIEKQKQNALATVNSPFYRSGVIPDIRREQANTNVALCIDNINKLYKSKFSDDLKEYIRDNTQVLSDWKITSINLSYIDPEKPNVRDLNELSFGFM